MRVYVADNMTTGERIISHNKKVFNNSLNEFDHRNAILVNEFDTSEYEVLKHLVNGADQGHELAKEVIKYIDEINMLGEK